MADVNLSTFSVRVSSVVLLVAVEGYVFYGRFQV